MSISPATPTTAYPLSIAPPVAQGIVDVNSALMGGDLSGAQSAFKSLAQVADPDPNSPYAPGITELTDTLKSGDLEGAQDALASLQQQVLDTRAASAMQPYGSGGTTAANSASEVLNIMA